jgi:hypothetical protein
MNDSAEVRMRQIAVIQQVKESVREFERGGADTEAEDIVLAEAAGLNAAKVREIWGPVKGRKGEPKKSLGSLLSVAELQGMLVLPAKAREEKLKTLIVQKSGVPKFQTVVSPTGAVQSLMNAVLGVDSFSQLGLRCRYDLFHDKMIVEVEGGAEIAFPGFHKVAGDGDKIVLRMRREALRLWDFDPGSTHMREAIELACLDNCFNPVLDYLDGLRWDGVERVDEWLITYFGAKDTELNRQISRKTLLAAVRRQRQPGCKYDFVLVLENERQGLGRGSALRIMAGDENFSDMDILHCDRKEQQELMKGVWIYELSELEGLSAVNAGKLKAFLSRQYDMARPAYGRRRVDWPRMGIFVGTTNELGYLNDTTGNRRILPVWIKGVIWSAEANRWLIDLEGLRRDRDQLWAEAAQIELGGEPLHISERLWSVAEVEQKKRVVSDGWEDLIENGLAQLKWEKGKKDCWCVAPVGGGSEMRVSSAWLLEEICEVQKAYQNKNVGSRLASVMRSLEWSRKVARIGGGATHNCYVKPYRVEGTVELVEEAVGPIEFGNFVRRV